MVARVMKADTVAAMYEAMLSLMWDQRRTQSAKEKEEIVGQSSN